MKCTMKQRSEQQRTQQNQTQFFTKTKNLKKNITKMIEKKAITKLRIFKDGHHYIFQYTKIRENIIDSSIPIS